MTAARDLLAIADLAAATDGVDPLSEASRLALRHRSPDRTVTRDDEVVAGVIRDGDAVELVVEPVFRRRGIGRHLVEHELLHNPQTRFWAHGDLPGAQALAKTAGLVVIRNLWRMARDVDASPAIEKPTVPTGFTARTFQPGDEDAWLDLNSRAFAYHPEQGRMTRADLDERMAEPWWDPQGLILIFDDATGALAASHWTKIAGDTPDEAEVYVVAVDPGHQGHGLGKVVTALGLAHLKDRGARTIDLYVEGDNDAAVATYSKLGFERAALDVMYAAAEA